MLYRYNKIEDLFCLLILNFAQKSFGGGYMSKIILTADSPCDLSEELIQRYNVNILPLHVILGDKDHLDGVNIVADDIYAYYDKHEILPKTAAIAPYEYIEYFKKWTDAGYSVIHFNISSNMSSSYQNACLAAEQLGNVYPIDSRNLSTGIGLLVLEAAERIAQGMPATQIVEEVTLQREKVQASFILNTLEYLHAGGRCSAIAALGANILNLKPCIEVNNIEGKMGVGKKYRGNLGTVLQRYVRDKLQDRTDLDLKRIFITHSGISQELVDLVRKTVEENANFQEILITRAGCTISSHCGPNTLGILFMTK